MKKPILDGSVRPWEASYTEAQRTPLAEADLHSTFVDVFDTAVANYPERTAFTVVLPAGFHVSISYADLEQRAECLAHYFNIELGLQKGDVLALHMPNCLHYPIALYAALKLGLTLTTVNPLYTPRELLHQLRDSGASALVAFNLFTGGLADVLEQLELQQVLVAAPWDFFPEDTAGLIRYFLEGDQKVVPAMDFDHCLFTDALLAGADYVNNPDKPERVSPSLSPEDTVLVQYTGGTTGVSKGALLSNSNVTAVLNMIMQFSSGAMGEEEIEQQTVLTIIPLYHIFAMMMNMTMFLKVGGHNVLIPNPNPIDNLRPAFENFGIDVMTGVDTLYAGLLSADWFLELAPEIRCAITGGTALRPATYEAWSRQVGDIIEGYGLTETACVVAFNPLDGRAKPGSVGLPSPGMDLRLLNEQGQAVTYGEPGELWVRGPNVTSAYLNLPEESELAFVDGWFNTGDVVTMDEDGFLYIVDRKKDMILVSGFNVFPNEVENVIADMPGIGDVAVIGIPDERKGEVPLAVVTRTDETVTAENVIAHCREHLTGYKIPRAVEFREELPKSPVGKILRKEILKDMDIDTLLAGAVGDKGRSLS